ncbi:LysR family transcriptional regulator [Nonomuraea sp. NPDC052116]|uniref:LysR family transcriptional regulator n=1 Tax=Nonomuraea sp. NPDC052116 TaxID=3155665 RepID=UPI003449638B
MLHLRYFIAVAEELNFSAAARKLHMAASPLSQRIKDLEHELGYRLFDRSTHHVTLTPAGNALLPIARDALDRVNSIEWRLREAMRPQRSTVLFGMPSGVHPDLRERVDILTGRVTERFDLKRWPGTASTLIAAVRDGRLALTLARLPVSEPGLDQLLVMSERLGAVVPADRFAGRDSVALAELTDLPYAGFPAEMTPAYFKQLDGQLSELGLKERIKLTGRSYDGLTEIISGGLAFSIAMLDDKSPIHQYGMENVAVLPFADFHPRLDTGLLWRRDRAHGGDLEELVEVAREIFAEPLSR